MQPSTKDLELKLKKLEEEIKIVKNQIKNRLEKRPKPKPHQSMAVVRICEEYFTELENGEHNPDIIFTRIMELVYGASVWSYIDSFDY